MIFDLKKKVDKILNKICAERSKHLISNPETILMVEIALPTSRQEKCLENIVREVTSTKQLNKHTLARYNFKLFCIFLLYNFTSTSTCFCQAVESKAGMRKWVLARTLRRHKSMSSTW